MTVGELGRRMDSAEFTDWQAYYRLKDAPDVPAAVETTSQETARIKATLRNAARR